MRRLVAVLSAVLAAAPVSAQHHGHGAEAPEPARDPSASQHSASPPPAASQGPAHAADTLFDPREMVNAREQLRAEHGGLTNYLVLADRFEIRTGAGEENWLWDFQGWYGGDIHKVWLKSEGEGDSGDGTERAGFQALYSRAISPFFDLQAGVRHDFSPDPERTHLVLGLHGLMPYRFEIDAAAFLSDEGDLTGRVESEFDLRIRQRLILQPRVELNVAAQEIAELRIGSGIGSIEAGVRLRYEMRREFAPYLGVGWERKLGETADLARTAGEDRGGVVAVLGVRAWF